MPEDQKPGIQRLRPGTKRGQVCQDMILVMEQRGMDASVIDEAVFLFFTGSAIPPSRKNA